jgi:hypothetical protein
MIIIGHILNIELEILFSQMKIKMFVFLIVCISSINSMNNIFSSKVKIISQSYFEPPISTHLIESDINVRSLIRCSALCYSHSICRTADYNSSGKVCRLFESISSVGMYLYDPTTSILAFNYCSNDTQTEPEYVCTRSGTFTVQQIFNSLNSAPRSRCLCKCLWSLYEQLQWIYIIYNVQ